MAELDGATFDVDRDADGRLVITIRGQLDITTTPALESAVDPLLETKPRLDLVLSEVTFADSSALALWVKWAAAAAEIRTRGVSPLLRKVIERTGLAGTLGLDG